MDNFALGDFTAEDADAWVEDDPSADGCVFPPEFVSNDYVRVTQLYCGAVGRQYKDYAKSERNVELDICSVWCSKPVPVLYDYCDTIKIHVFWPLLFQHQHSSVISRLYPCVGPSNFRASEISLKQLQRLELMEDIVDLAKKVVNDSFFIGGLLRIGYKIENKMLAMEEALNWVKYIGDVRILHKLGAVDNCWPMLSIFFTEYKYHITKVVTENCNILEEFKRQNCTECLEQGEVMKMKGNEEFSKERFDVAIVYYSRAIEYSPDNHLFYGNRALCFLRTRQFRNALGDGKRAIILKNNWTKEKTIQTFGQPSKLLGHLLLYFTGRECSLKDGFQFNSKSRLSKGHYRYCAALSMLGEYDWALQANIKAQKLCRNDPEGIKDLIQQHVKLQKQIEDLQGGTSTRNPIKSCCESRACTPSSSAPACSTSLEVLHTRKTSDEMASGGHPNSRDIDEAYNSDDCDCPEYLATSSQPPRHRGKQKSRNNESEPGSSSQESLQADLKTFLERAFSKSSRAARQDFANIMKMLRSLVQDGYTALLEQRCRSAAQAFSELLGNLDPQKIKQLNLAMINYVLVVYGFAISLLGIGQPQELTEAEGQFKRMIEFYPNEGLDCLAYCGIGKVYLKKNRFGEALDHFEQAKALIYRLPGVLTWPTSNVVIEETQPGKIKTVLEKFIEECRFPPVPDAICSYQNCCGASKVQIYITDPDFKGFIRLSCCQYCKIEFHINCWKKLKTTTYNDKIDKDFLQGVCLTPDCKGIISKIIIFSSRGQVKCEFEHKVIKEKAPPRPVLKQKCSSLEKQKLKEDKKVKRKTQKQEAKKLAQERLEEDLRESNPPKPEEQKETAARVQHCELLDDRILQCIKLSADKIQAGVRDTSKLLKELLSWKVLSTEDYTTCFSSRNFLNEAVDYVIRHLIQEKNRVKTRIFLHVLSKLDMEPKLATWIQKLNSFGLDAAGSFFSCYGAPLKELDFSIMTFLWNEKYGNKLKSIEGKKLEDFCEPEASEDARFLIWLLEEHREKFPALHAALDEFFDIMDSRCTVLRKQDSNDVPVHTTKTKNKGKKKKLKDSKPLLVGSGTSSVTSNNETVALGGDLKSSTDPAGPFAVPEHLRQDVEEFEALYEQQNGEYVVRDKQLWPMNPKQKSSTLYDYFSQFLEEHGPLDMSNRMFCEKYEFFPEETRTILENAGGLKSFLLQCPRFVVIDNCIALRKYASRLKKKRKKKNSKAKIEEISITGDFLRITLPLSSMFREFKPDVMPEPVSDLSSVPASEDVEPEPEPEPEPADSPQPACEAEEPTPVSEDSRTSAPEEEKPEEVLPEAPPEPVPEGAAAPQASSRSPKPAPDAVKATYWAPAHLVTGHCTSLPFRGFDITQTPPAYINVLPTLPECTHSCTPVAATASKYPLQRSVPGVPTLVASDRPDDSATVYFEAPCVNAEHAPGSQVASEAQVHYDRLEIPGESQGNTEGADPTHSEPSRDDGHSGESADREASPERTDEAADSEANKGAHARAVAVQVSVNTTHQEVNTEPCSAFEAQQEDISQIQRENLALRRQLKKVCDYYVQTRIQGSEAIQILGEKLRRSETQNEISKAELDWFHEDLEKGIKEWQEEKKEMQERVQVLMKRMKSIAHALELYAQEDEGSDKGLEFLLSQPSEISQAFINEKMKLEENVRVGKKYFAKVHRRAVSAELFVLETVKKTELRKLWILESQADRYLDTLKNLDREAAIYINLDPYMQTWESFVSDVRREMKSAESQFDERIEAVKEGAWLCWLPPVQIMELSFPPYNPMQLGSPPESPSPDYEDRGPSTFASYGAGDRMVVPEDSSPVSAADQPTGAPSPSQPASPPDQPEAAQPPACTDTVQAAQSKPRPAADQKPPVPAVRAARPSHSPKKPFNTIIEHLSVAFPGYSSTELAGFVKKVRSKSKNSLAGLSVDDIVQRVTQHILEEGRSRKPHPGQDGRPGEPRSATSVTGPLPGTQGPRTDGVPAPGAHHCEVCHQVIRPRSLRVLACGHKCHKGCLQKSVRGQGSCPACLSSGEQPAPSGGDRLLS